MPNLQVKDPAERFDLAYLFANGDAEEIKKLADTAKEFSARCAMVHVADLRRLAPFLEGSSVRPEVVIDFPDGLGGWQAKEAEARQAKEDGAVGGDPVINLRYVAERNRQGIIRECQLVRAQLDQVKLISQIPYLWQKDPNAIPWILDLLPEAGVYCVKDWTTRYNFYFTKKKDGTAEKLDDTVDTRVLYTESMPDYITKHNLPLRIKIAGGVDATNAKRFVNAGADFLGLSYGKAKSVREALLQK